MVRVPGYRSRSPGFDYRRCQIFWEVGGLERCPLSLMLLRNFGESITGHEQGLIPFLGCRTLFFFCWILNGTVSIGAGIARSVWRLATGWRTKGSEFESR
jgi:hypothetical protein